MPVLANRIAAIRRPAPINSLAFASQHQNRSPQPSYLHGLLRLTFEAAQK